MSIKSSNFQVSSVVYDENVVTVIWGTDQKSVYHNIWLRDNCWCKECYHDITKQRLLNSCLIDDDIKAIEAVHAQSSITVTWNQNSHKSVYASSWLALHSYNPVLIPSEFKTRNEYDVLSQFNWNVEDIENNMPEVDFKDVMESEESLKNWCSKIWKYGFCMINNVPISPEETEKLVERITYIRPTHYGAFWDFTSDLDKNDTAYTNIDIASHTDGTYWSDTPGLQLFHLLSHEGTGGCTSLVDAFNCAFKFRKQYPEYYELLSRIPIPAHSAGEEDVCIQPAIPQPIFKHDHENKLIQVRWNQSDRSTMNNWSDPDDVVLFYKAIRAWYKLITDKEHEFFYQLKPGQCLIFDNWRCFHSRTEFTGKRRMCGAYVNRDDFISKLKLLNLGRESVLETL